MLGIHGVDPRNERIDLDLRLVERDLIRPSFRRGRSGDRVEARFRDVAQKPERRPDVLDAVALLLVEVDLLVGGLDEQVRDVAERGEQKQADEQELGDVAQPIEGSRSPDGRGSSRPA
jgi:hypothetical protein